MDLCKNGHGKAQKEASQTRGAVLRPASCHVQQTSLRSPWRQASRTTHSCWLAPWLGVDTCLSRLAVQQRRPSLFGIRPSRE